MTTHTRAVHSSVPDSPAERGVREYGLHERVWRILPIGRENAITTDRIADLLGLPRTRTNQKIRQVCTELRETMDRPVYSCNNGYYIAEEKADIDPYIDNMENRIAAMQEDVDTAKRQRERLAETVDNNGGFLFPGIAGEVRS